MVSYRPPGSVRRAVRSSATSPERSAGPTRPRAIDPPCGIRDSISGDLWGLGGGVQYHHVVAAGWLVLVVRPFGAPSSRVAWMNHQPLPMPLSDTCCQSASAAARVNTVGRGLSQGQRHVAVLLRPRSARSGGWATRWDSWPRVARAARTAGGGARGFQHPATATGQSGGGRRCVKRKPYAAAAYASFGRLAVTTSGAGTGSGSACGTRTDARCSPPCVRPAAACLSLERCGCSSSSSRGPPAPRSYSRTATHRSKLRPVTTKRASTSSLEPHVISIYQSVLTRRLAPRTLREHVGFSTSINPKGIDQQSDASYTLVNR